MLANHVGALYTDRFDGIALGKAAGASVATTGNTAVTIPITSGTAYIVRKITVANANKSIATANVVVLTSSDGNASNAVSNVTVLSSVSSNATFQDVGLATAAATTVYSAPALYVKLNVAVSGGTCDITVFGDVVKL